MTENNVELDQQVRYQIYDSCLKRGYPPQMLETASLLKTSQADIRDSFARLAAGRVLVLQPATGEILMANPFSAVPTPFLVETSGFTCFANCIWDALGVPAMLGQDALIRCSCADCGSAIELEVVASRVTGSPTLLHFTVPARRWWDDIVFT